MDSSIMEERPEPPEPPDPSDRSPPIQFAPSSTVAGALHPQDIELRKGLDDGAKSRAGLKRWISRAGLKRKISRAGLKRKISRAGLKRKISRAGLKRKISRAGLKRKISRAGLKRKISRAGLKRWISRTGFKRDCDINKVFSYDNAFVIVNARNKDRMKAGSDEISEIDIENDENRERESEVMEDLREEENVVIEEGREQNEREDTERNEDNVIMDEDERFRQWADETIRTINELFDNAEIAQSETNDQKIYDSIEQLENEVYNRFCELDERENLRLMNGITMEDFSNILRGAHEKSVLASHSEDFVSNRTYMIYLRVYSNNDTQGIVQEIEEMRECRRDLVSQGETAIIEDDADLLTLGSLDDSDNDGAIQFDSQNDIEIDLELMQTVSKKSKKRKRGRLSQRRRTRTDKDNNRDRMRNIRENESQEQTNRRLQNDAIRRRIQRESESQERRTQRQDLDTIQHRSQRQNESQEQRTQRIQQISQRQVTQRRNTQARNLNVTRMLARMELDDENDIQIYDIGNMTAECRHCKALHFEDEKPAGTPGGVFTKCCKKGKLNFGEVFEDYPLELYNLYTQNDEHSKDFKEQLRNYNSAHAFASMKAENQIRSVMPFCYKVQGQIYHTVNLAAHPDPNEQPEYAQLFFIDSAEALDIRMSTQANVNCNRNLMAKIDTILRRVSPYYASFKFMKEVEEEVEREAQNLGIDPPQLKLLFDISATKVDKRRYNIPRSNEVAAVFVLKDNEELPEAEGLAIHQRGRQLQKITKFEKRAESMLYPLYFPTGKGGCSAMMRVNNEKVTFAQYYRYMMAIRKSSALVVRDDADSEYIYGFCDYKWDEDPNELNDFNPIRLGGKLYQQYLVDAYVKIEQDRLDYIRKNQNELKVENYKALNDYLQDTADEQGKKVGKTIILPSSFKGSPRNCMQAYQDSMALVRKYGKPSAFITFTCNPKWQEIVRNLQPGNKAIDEPDLVDRVFNLKLDELMDDCVKKQYYGEVIAYTYVVEFQKRGLPHAHILLIFDNDDKIKDADDINRMVWAEIPDKDKYPRLFEIVTSHMIHGPCGAHNMNCPCMAEDKNGKKYCSKDYPKEFREATSFGADSYAKYRRRDDGRHIFRNGAIIDNRWVVPYSPVLSLKYDAHINVEICASIKSVKYLYKYVYKGHDCARMVISVDNSGEIVHDEVKKFVNMRYVTPHEAYWRIAEFTLDEKSHAVTRLDLHLPNEQLVCYKPNNDNIRDRLNDAELRNTTLTAWFRLNMRDRNAKKFYYYEIPEHYTFKKDGNNMIWDRKGGMTGRVVKPCIGRMYAIPPKLGELFYLRTLLLHKKGATSWEDLLITEDFDGDPHPKGTFREAAEAMGLLNGNIIWENYFNEIINTAMPYQLRELFVSVITHGENVDVKRLWEQFKEYFAEDFRRTHEQEIAERRALVEIEKQLENAGDSITNYGVEKPNMDEFENELPWDPNEEMEKGRTMRASMNPAQERIVAYVMDLIDQQQNGTMINGCVYVDGPGGSGKTYTYQVICYLLRGLGIKYKTSAWMGIAANLIPDGRTMHKTFGLPFEMDSKSSSNAKHNNRIGKELLETNVFIVDEISMVPKHAIDIIDRKLKELTGINLPFGGKIFIIGGDFRQILPVQRRAGRSELVGLSVVKSSLWNNFKVFRLKENRRVIQDDPNNRTNQPVRESFAQWLLKLGNGKIPSDEDFIKIPDSCITDNDLIDEVFGESIANKDFDQISKRVILTTTNERVHEINARVLERLQGEEEKVYLSVDTVDTDEPNGAIVYPPEFLNSYNESGLPPHELKVQINSPVMLKRNLNPSAGLCNGTRLRVKVMHQNLLECEYINGDRGGQRVFIPRITLSSAKGNLPFTLFRRQFPVTLCYAMTINKSQGQTIDFAGLDLGESVFTHGQTYVAFSRVRAWDFLKVRTCEEKKGKVKNIVWKEVLLKEDEEEIEESQGSQRQSRRSTQRTDESQRSEEL